MKNIPITGADMPAEYDLKTLRKVPRGTFHRVAVLPPSAGETPALTPDIREWFTRHTPGGDWEAGIRDALRQYIAAHEPA